MCKFSKPTVQYYKVTWHLPPPQMPLYGRKTHAHGNTVLPLLLLRLKRKMRDFIWVPSLDVDIWVEYVVQHPAGPANPQLCWTTIATRALLGVYAPTTLRGVGLQHADVAVLTPVGGPMNFG